MAKQTINIGSAPNDGTGDPLRDAFDKANDNFAELYDADADFETRVSALEAGGGAGDLLSTNNLSDLDDIPTARANLDVYSQAEVDALIAGGGTAPTECIIVALGDETTALTTGTAKVTLRMPYAFTLTAVRASVTTAPTGSTLIVDINESGSTILSTKLSIDASEKTSTTAASAAVISDTALADDAEITFDIDQVGSTIAGKGLKVYLIGH